MLANWSWSQPLPHIQRIIMREYGFALISFPSLFYSWLSQTGYYLTGTIWQRFREIKKSESNTAQRTNDGININVYKQSRANHTSLNTWSKIKPNQNKSKSNFGCKLFKSEFLLVLDFRGSYFFLLQSLSLSLSVCMRICEKKSERISDVTDRRLGILHPICSQLSSIQQNVYTSKSETKTWPTALS